jgi:hypothetical protein
MLLLYKILSKNELFENKIKATTDEVAPKFNHIPLSSFGINEIRKSSIIANETLPITCNRFLCLEILLKY